MSVRIRKVRAAPVENGADAPAWQPSGKATPRLAATGGGRPSIGSTTTGLRGHDAMATVGDDDLIRPESARRISEDREMEKLKQLLEKKKKVEMEAHALHQTFIEREVDLAEARRNVTAMVRRAAEDGKREVMALRFPSDWCTDGGRAINNFESHWPETLTGFAKRAYEYYEQELRPAGYKVRVQIVDYPGGVPGDVGIFLSW